MDQRALAGQVTDFSRISIACRAEHAQHAVVYFLGWPASSRRLATEFRRLGCWRLAPARASTRHQSLFIRASHHIFARSVLRGIAKRACRARWCPVGNARKRRMVPLGPDRPTAGISEWLPGESMCFSARGTIGVGGALPLKTTVCLPFTQAACASKFVPLPVVKDAR